MKYSQVMILGAYRWELSPPLQITDNKLCLIYLILSFGNKLDLEIQSNCIKFVSIEHTCIRVEASYAEAWKGTTQSFGCRLNGRRLNGSQWENQARQCVSRKSEYFIKWDVDFEKDHTTKG